MKTIRLNKKQIDLFDTGVKKVINGTIYRYLPYWFKEIKDKNKDDKDDRSIFEIISPEKLPSELKEELLRIRKNDDDNNNNNNKEYIPPFLNMTIEEIQNIRERYNKGLNELMNELVKDFKKETGMKITDIRADVMGKWRIKIHNYI